MVKAVFQLKTHSAIQPVFKGWHQHHIQAPVLGFHAHHGQHRRKPAPFKGLRVAIEHAAHHTPFDVARAPGLVIGPT
jgi:hypothetical protein